MEEKHFIESIKQYLKMSLNEEFTKIKNNLLTGIKISYKEH